MNQPSYKTKTINSYKFFEFQVTAVCFDNVTRTIVDSTKLIELSRTNALEIINKWNRQGQGKYTYALTGHELALTRDQEKNLKIYEGSDRYYL